MTLRSYSSNGYMTLDCLFAGVGQLEESRALEALRWRFESSRRHQFMNKEKYMNEQRNELFEEFKAEWPRMFRSVACGFYLPKAWTHILWAVCQEIERELKCDDECPLVDVQQVKSKFGGLRFYFTGGNANISAIVRMAEVLSSKTCGTCGITSKSIIGSDHSLNCVPERFHML